MLAVIKGLPGTCGVRRLYKIIDCGLLVYDMYCLMDGPCNLKAVGSHEILVIVTVLKPELHILMVTVRCIIPIVL